MVTIDFDSIPSMHHLLPDVVTTHNVFRQGSGELPDKDVSLATCQAGLSLVVRLPAATARRLARALVAAAVTIDGHGVDGCPTCGDTGWVKKPDATVVPEGYVTHTCPNC
jgi:hypothetical protein